MRNEKEEVRDEQRMGCLGGWRMESMKNLSS